MKNLKTTLIATLTVISFLATTQVASAASHPAAAKKQTVKFTVTGDCKGEEEMIEGESEDNCKIVATISSASPSRSAVLEQLNDDDEWDEAASAKSKSGKVSFKIDATDEDDAWLDGDFTFRVVVAKSGTNKAYTSKEYTFTFTPAESDESDESDDSGSGEASSKQKSKSTGDKKLDSVMDKMDDKNTTFDDDCKKFFGEDCKLMFTPTGPNWAKLSAAKWQPMCEKLLKQSADNCKKMYGSFGPPAGGGNNNSGGGNNNSGGSPSGGSPSGGSPSGGSPSGGSPSGGSPSGGSPSGGSPSGGGNNNSGGSPSGGSNNMVKITEADIKKACTAAGITDCDPIIKAMTSGTPPNPTDMGKLLGSKMDAFFKAMPQQPNNNSGGSNNNPGGSPSGGSPSGGSNNNSGGPTPGGPTPGGPPTGGPTNQPKK